LCTAIFFNRHIETALAQFAQNLDMDSLLPDELWLHVFSFVSPRDLLCGCALVSVHFQQLATDEHVWKHHCLLAATVTPPMDTRSPFEHSLGWYILRRRRVDEQLSWLQVYRECCFFASTSDHTASSPMPCGFVAGLSQEDRHALRRLVSPTLSVPMRLLESVGPSADSVVSGLLAAFDYTHRDALTLALATVSHFLRVAQDQTELLLSSSPLNRLLLFYLKPRCEHFLSELSASLRSAVRRLSRTDRQSLPTLAAVVFTEVCTSSLTLLPRELRRVCHHLHRESNHRGEALKLISTLVFYRLINPRLIMEPPIGDRKLWRQVVVTLNDTVSDLCEKPSAGEAASSVEYNRRIFDALLQQLVSLKASSAAGALSPPHTLDGTREQVDQDLIKLLRRHLY